MFLFTLHSPIQLELMQATKLQISYIQQIKIEKFDIVEYFQHFGYKERDVADASFKDLVNTILLLANVLRNDIKRFAEFHHETDFVVIYHYSFR